MLRDESAVLISIGVLTISEHVFIKKHIMLERHNTDPAYFRSTILENFPELSSYTNVFSLWQLRGNKTELVPLSAQINSAMALCQGNQELNRSSVYIRPVVSLHMSVILNTTNLFEGNDFLSLCW